MNQDDTSKTNGLDVVDIGTLFGVRPSIDLDLSSDALLQMMGKSGVEETLICSLKAVQFNFTAGNDETLALCREHPALHPVAVVDPRQAPDCFREVERCAKLGFIAFRLLREYQGWNIDNKAFEKLLQAIDRTGKPVIVHTPASGDATALLRIAGGWDLPVILAAVTYSTLSEALAVMGDAPNFHIEAHRLSVPGQVELMTEEAGAERLLFGSWAPMHEQRPSLEMVLASGIDSVDKALILGGNARRVFGLEQEADHATT